jgi:hypothetical protein
VIWNKNQEKQIAELVEKFSRLFWV